MVFLSMAGIHDHGHIYFQSSSQKRKLARRSGQKGKRVCKVQFEYLDSSSDNLSDCCRSNLVRLQLVRLLGIFYVNLQYSGPSTAINHGHYNCNEPLQQG